MDEDLRLKKTYAGIVEDNNDPKRLSRVKVRVFEVFSDIDKQDIPWASPWKDLNGENFILPEVGKVVTVIFENGDLYKPEYIYAEHFNINLENKLKSLSDNDYKSMKSVLFNHKTQIYVNESEGLKIDHKFNNINIKDKSININLKDNFGKINIGDETANQEAVLGTNFFKWFDEFIDILSGKDNGPFLGNLAAPVAPTPALLASIQKYKQLKQSKFLSKNVFLNDNYDISTIRQNREDRPNISQIGDDYRSTETDINLKEFEFVDFNPIYGNGDETPDGQLTTSDGENVSGLDSVGPIIGEANPDINKILRTMEAKKYVVETKPYYINIIGVRNQYEGQPYSNLFKDEMWVIWRDDEGKWENKKFPISTIPGFEKHKDQVKKDSKGNPIRINWKEFLSLYRTRGGGIMVPAQYQNIYTFYEATSSNPNTMKGKPYFHVDGRPQKAYRDKNFKDNIITFSNKNNIDVGVHAFLIHRGFPGGALVNNWSEGCQVLQKESDLDQLAKLARLHIKKGNGNRFHYTLITGKDIEEANKGISDNTSNNSDTNNNTPSSDYVPLPDDGSNDVVYGMDIRKLRGVIPDKVLEKIPETMRKFKIDTPYKLSHFLGQCSHESGGFKSTSENLNYSRGGILGSSFRKYFSNKNDYEEVDNFTRNPEKLANRVYGGRKDLGSRGEQSGDGWNYRGRGYIQLTGRANYIEFAKYIKDDVVSDPELVSGKYSLVSAAYFFNKRSIWNITENGIDKKTITRVTKLVNGGNTGLDDRIKYTEKFYKIITS